jgi:hypothetical protein
MQSRVGGYAGGNVPLLVRRDRKGWVKYALQFGAPIYPAYTFGEERTYWTWLGCMPLRLAANKYQLPGAVFLGKWCLWFPWNHTELITGQIRPPPYLIAMKVLCATVTCNFMCVLSSKCCVGTSIMQ